MARSPKDTPLRTHVRALRERAGIESEEELSRRAGLGESYVRQWLNGKSGEPRAAKLGQIAAVLNVTLTELLTPYEGGGAGAVGRIPVRPATTGLLPVRFAVQAGAWIERDELSQALPPGPPVTADARYPSEAQWLELVRGDSMDLYYPEGAWVHVVDAIAIGYLARDEDFVTIERKREQGGLVERSLKQIALRRGKIELWPRSKNPRWNGPLPLGAPKDEDDEVRIAALVIGGYLPVRR